MICIVSLLTILIIQIECMPHHNNDGTEILNTTAHTDNDYLEDNPIEIIFPSKALLLEAATDEYIIEGYVIDDKPKVNTDNGDDLGKSVNNDASTHSNTYDGSNADADNNEDKDGNKETHNSPEEIKVKENAGEASNKDTRSVNVLVSDILEELEKANSDETEEKTPNEIVVIDSDCEGGESVKCSRSADTLFVEVPAEPENYFVPVHGRARFACHFGPEPNYPATTIPSEPFYGPSNGPPYIPPYDIWYGPPYDPYYIPPDLDLDDIFETVPFIQTRFSYKKRDTATV